ncbi:MAG: hypothetical protein HKP38_06240 [Croceitalea sp.]|nr:hypothetical protein [Croceitalea sp.]MBT8237471.1 hypothetical protein [Croceitalea sp.]NNC35276.1 hypothetical protein [Croceitalea sp.]NNL08806.1 hypothetical protein [Croceitalea sp.]NNM17372.1 hypothetical protein [Croceitalea sp.]
MNQNNWTKEELNIYIFLLCAEADSIITAEEIDLIKVKYDPQVFDRIYEEFKKDSEDEGLDKVERSIHSHDYSDLELDKIKEEMYKIFLTDNKLNIKESNLKRILDNILY